MFEYMYEVLNIEYRLFTKLKTQLESNLRDKYFKSN